MQTGTSGFIVPEGLNDSSDSTQLVEVLAVYCQEMCLKKDPSRRERSELVCRRVNHSSSHNVPSDPIIPFPNGTARPFCIPWQ